MLCCNQIKNYFSQYKELKGSPCELWYNIIINPIKINKLNNRLTFVLKFFTAYSYFSFSLNLPIFLSQ
jgi:hypothetical protein